MRKTALILILLSLLGCNNKNIDPSIDVAKLLSGTYQVGIIRSSDSKFDDIALPKNGYTSVIVVNKISDKTVNVSTTIITPTGTNKFDFVCIIDTYFDPAFNFILKIKDVGTPLGFATTNGKSLRIQVPNSNVLLDSVKL